MKILKYILLLIIALILLKDRQCFAKFTLEQNQLKNLNAHQFADKNYYLIDSLQLETLIKSDRQMIDSCLKIYHTTKHDIDKINAINHIVEKSWDDALWPKYNIWMNNQIQNLLNKTHSALITKKLKILYAGTLNNIGYQYKAKGNIAKALDYYHQALKIDIEIGNNEGIAYGLNNMGVIYKSQGDITMALDYYHKALEMQEKIGDKAGIARSLNNIGVIYNNQGDITMALDYYNKALKIRDEIRDKKGIANSLNNIGGIYQSKGDITKALEYYHQTLKIQEEIGNREGIAYSLNNIGTIYDNQEDILKALYYYHKALKIFDEIGHKKGIAMSLNNIGAIELKQGRVKDAEKHLKKGLIIAQEISSQKWISKNSGNLSRVLKKKGNYQLALEMFELHIQIRDSMASKENAKAAIKQQMKYEYEKKVAVANIEHSAKLERQKVVAAEQEKKQNIIIASVSGGLLLVMLFSIFLFNRIRMIHKQKSVIEKQKEEVDRAYYHLEEKNTEILDSIQYAKRIQSAILPPQKVVKESIPDSFILYKPKDVVAGDFYWIESVPPTGNKKDAIILFAAADCTGHGVPGAMVSVVCNNALNRSVREYGLTEPGEILDKTREIVIQEFEKSEDEVKDGMDIALCSLERNILKYAGALNPLWVIRDKTIIEIKANKQPIGKFDNPKPYTTHTFELQKGDSIYIFSDGYVDQFGGEKGKKFKAKAFRELLLSIQNKSMEEQKNFIDKSFETWKGNLEQLDDVCVIGVKI